MTLVYRGSIAGRICSLYCSAKNMIRLIVARLTWSCNRTASANNALLYCNDESRKGLLGFIDYVGSNFTTSGISENNLSEYNAKLISVCLILQKDLEETKPSFLFEPTK